MSRWRLYYHLVWATRGRQATIRPEVEERIHGIMRAVAQRFGVLVHAIGGVEDHVHLAVSIPPAMPVSTAVQRIKGASSRAISEELGLPFNWQPEYYVDTFSERHLPKVAAYIETQHQHHADMTVWHEIEP